MADTQPNENLFKPYREFMSSPARIKVLEKILPKHLNAEQFASIAINAAVKNPALLECDFPSIYTSIVQAAELGLPPNTALGLSYLIPHLAGQGQDAQGNWLPKKRVCRLEVGYKGLIALAYRSGIVGAVNCEAVYLGEPFKVQYGTKRFIMHEPRFETVDKKQLTHTYVTFDLAGGARSFRVFGIHDIERARSFSESGKDKTGKGGEIYNAGVWKEHYIPMAKKSVIKDGMKLIPLTADISKVLSLDHANATGDFDQLEFNNQEALPENAQVIVAPTVGRVADKVRVTAAGAPRVSMDPAQDLREKLYPSMNRQLDADIWIGQLGLKSAEVFEQAAAAGIQTPEAFENFANAMREKIS